MKRMFIWLTLLFLATDLATKIWAEGTLMIGAKQETVVPYLSWSLLYNEGLSFGFLESNPRLVLLLNFIAISVVIYILIKYMSYSFLWYISGALIIAGGIGNFVNRLFSGHVIDFISLQGYPAIFNVADIETRLGMVFILILVLKEYVSEKLKQKVKNI